MNCVVSDWPRGDNTMAEFKNIRVTFENVGLPQVAVDHSARLRQTEFLEAGVKLFDAGKLRVIVDRVYPPVHVRATAFLQHFFFLTWAAESIVRDGTIRLPFGAGRTSPNRRA